MKKIIDFHKNNWIFILTIISFVVAIAVFSLSIVFLDMEIFFFSFLLQVAGYGIIIGYFLATIIIVIYEAILRLPMKVRLFLKRPIFRKIPIVVLFLIITFIALTFDKNILDNQSLKELINISWIIFTINITIFIFTYAFNTNRLEKNKQNSHTESNTDLFAKTNYNLEVHSRYGTFKFIFVNALLLVPSTVQVFFRPMELEVYKSTFTITIVSFMFSTNTLFLVLSEIFFEINNKKRELQFEESLIIKEQKKAVEVVTENKYFILIKKNLTNLTKEYINSNLFKIAERHYENQIIGKIKDKNIKPFVKLSIELIKLQDEIILQFEKMDELIANLSSTSEMIEFEGIISIQKKIRKMQSVSNRIAKKILKIIKSKN